MKMYKNILKFKFLVCLKVFSKNFLAKTQEVQICLNNDFKTSCKDELYYDDKSALIQNISSLFAFKI